MANQLTKIKGGWKAIPDQMESDLKYSHTCSLNQPFLFTEEGKITPLSLYGKSPRQITHLGHPCVMVHHTYHN